MEREPNTSPTTENTNTTAVRYTKHHVVCTVPALERARANSLVDYDHTDADVDM